MELKIQTIPMRESYLCGDSGGEQVDERSNPRIPAVAAHKIPDVAILDQKYKFLDLNIVRTHFINEGRLSTRQAYKIIADAENVLKKENNVVRVDRKAFIIGDIHGQFYDLISILSNFELPRDSLVFLGDYVDRGFFSTETYLYLLLLKTHYPENIVLLRGNHESRKMTSYFTLRSECRHKYGQDVYERIVESFMALPLAAIVQEKAFCCHGGISPSLEKIEDIDKINRFQEVDYKGLLCDIMWSDPHADYNKSGKKWITNHKRRCSFFYNFELIRDFLDKNSLDTVIRGHEVQQTGYQVFESYKGTPSLVTIFSAPNYCDAYKNMGALVEFDQRIVSIKQFDAVEHPFVLRGFIDGINWSLPFVFEKVLDFTSSVLSEIKRAGQGDAESSDSTEAAGSLSQKEARDIELSLEKIITDSDIEEIKTPIAIMRTERENIDEFEDEESAFDCCTLETREIQCGEFGDVKIKDAINEVKKGDDTITPPISIEISPSLQLENLKVAADGGVENIAENSTVLTIDNNIKDVKTKPRRRRSWLSRCCLG